MPAKTILTAAFATLALAAAAPAMAAPSSEEAASVTKTERADNPGQRYCILWDLPNSHIKQRECRTLDRWQARGVDPRLMPRRR